VVATFGLVLVVSRFRDVSVSGWEIAAGIAQWYVGVACGWMTDAQVPMFVANGRTRRDAFTEWGMSAGLLSIWAASLITIGSLIEALVYGIGDWPLVVDEPHLFGSHTDVGSIFLEYALTFLVWAAVGGFVGASLDRSRDVGWLSLIPGAVLLAPSGSFDRSEIGIFGVITRRLPVLDVTAVGGAVLVALACTAIAVVLAWLVVRDLPLRNK